MKVTFVVCNIDLVQHRGSLAPQWESTYREGVASMAALLRARGVEVRLLKLSAGVSRARLLGLWRSQLADSDVAAFTINTVDLPEGARVAGILKGQWPRLRTICGGVHPTLSPEACIAEPAFDMVCRGEGEHVMEELCAKLAEGGDVRSIPGLWTKQAGAVQRNAVRPLVADLSTLPPPARDLGVVSDYDQRRVQDHTFFMATRGCPYQCAYCCNHSLSQVYPNPQSYYRSKPVHGGQMNRTLLQSWTTQPRCPRSPRLPELGRRYQAGIERSCKAGPPSPAAPGAQGYPSLVGATRLSPYGTHTLRLSVPPPEERQPNATSA